MMKVEIASKGKREVTFRELGDVGKCSGYVGMMNDMASFVQWKQLGFKK